jgi:HAD superfamily hydrolase (TIGR01549 family)
MPITAVFFDIGETLVDETEQWGWVADRLEVPRLTFFAAAGAVVAAGEARVLREVLRMVRPDLDAAEALHFRDGRPRGFTADDLYADVRPCLRELRERGYRIGVAGNQPPAADAVLRAAGLPFEWLLISALEGVAKPDPAFFARILDVSGLPASAIAYVGDRVDNDVLPATAAGMTAVHIRRGPWGVVQAQWPGIERAALRLRTLSELPALLDTL